MSTGRETWRDGWQVSFGSYVNDKVHANQDVKQEMTMEQPEACVEKKEHKYRIVRKSQY